MAVTTLILSTGKTVLSPTARPLTYEEPGKEPSQFCHSVISKEQSVVLSEEGVGGRGRELEHMYVKYKAAAIEPDGSGSRK
jgi:hypothetical protein